MIPPTKRFDIFPPDWGIYSEGLDAFRSFFNIRCHNIDSDHVFGKKQTNGFGPFSFKFFVPINKKSRPDTFFFLSCFVSFWSFLLSSLNPRLFVQ